MLIYSPSWRHQRVYIYNAKLICFPIFVLISLTVNTYACMTDTLKGPSSCVLTSNKSFLSLSQPVLPPFSPAQPRPVLDQSAEPSLACAFVLALLYSQADCAVTSPWFIPLQKAVFCRVAIDNHLTPRWELILNNAWETLESNGRVLASYTQNSLYMEL